MSAIEKCPALCNEENRPRRRVLFITTASYGQANVILATAHELLQHKEYEVHISSFIEFEDRITALNKRAGVSGADAARFHPILNLRQPDIAQDGANYFGPFRPGFRGAADTYKITVPAVATSICGWERYMDVYEYMVELVATLEADCVAVDPAMCPALDACISMAVPYAILSPNTFREILAKEQPFLATFCRFPALATAWPYPVPLHLIPANIYLKLRLLLNVFTSRQIQSIVRTRRRRGLPGIPPIFKPYHPKVQYLVPSIAESDFPSVTRPNVTGCGPIVLPTEPLNVTDPELAQWVGRGPTILVNMGSLVRMDDEMVRAFSAALKMVLDRHPRLQILWKIKSSGGFGMMTRTSRKQPLRDPGPVTKNSSEALGKELVADRVRIVEWLSVEPLAILQSGSIVCSVHHGGSNSYHEALSCGIPQIILPVWFDTYDFANRVEYLGIGIFASKTAAPRADADELGAALCRVVSESSAEAIAMRKRAQELARVCGAVGGRKLACKMIVSFADERLSLTGGAPERMNARLVKMGIVGGRKEGASSIGSS